MAFKAADALMTANGHCELCTCIEISLLCTRKHKHIVMCQSKPNTIEMCQAFPNKTVPNLKEEAQPRGRG